jgi:PAS domain S-box-containing protein
MNTQPMHPQASGEGRAQMQEEQSEQLFQTVWETAIEAMVLSDPDGIVLIANPAYYRLYGYTPEEVLGKDFAIIFPEAQRQWARQRYQERFRSPIIRPPAESSVIRADGTERLVESSYSFITQDGTRMAMLSIVHDITERKRLEELNYEQAQELAISRERQRLARELHDSISQLLFGIGLSVQMAREALDETETVQALDAISRIDQYVKAAKAEMRTLLYELRPELLEAEGLVSALSKHVAFLSDAHRLQVNMSLDEEPEVPLQVKQTLYRIALEALHNVVKHADASVITLRLACEHEALALEVRDNGKGFDTTRGFAGQLGLRSIQERVAAINGTFSIESGPGQGATLVVSVPF